MGNSESYRQVAKPCVNEDATDQIQDDLTFVFHTTDEDTADRVVHDYDSDLLQLPFVVTSSGRMISERRDFEKLQDLAEVFRQVKPGDAVEFVTPGKRYHWAVYTGESTFIHLKKNKVSPITTEELLVKANCTARVVNSVYKMTVLPCVQIINNAQTQVEKPLIWNSSESFVMWCRTGKAEFTTAENEIQNLDSMTPKTTKGKYMLEVHTPEETVMRRFLTLSKLIEYKRNVEKHGLDYLINKAVY